MVKGHRSKRTLFRVTSDNLKRTRLTFVGTRRLQKRSFSNPSLQSLQKTVVMSSIFSKAANPKEVISPEFGPRATQLLTSRSHNFIDRFECNAVAAAKLFLKSFPARAAKLFFAFIVQKLVQKIRS